MPPKSFNVPLQKSGYATGFVGKYMNGYEMSTNYLGKHFAPAKVAGWDSFEAILGGGYPGGASAAPGGTRPA